MEGSDEIQSTPRTSSTTLKGFLSVVLILTLELFSSAQVLPASGSIIVVDANPTINNVPMICCTPGAILRIDPATGAQEVISSGGNLITPIGLALHPDGSIVVADRDLPGVVRINPATGAQTVLSSGGLLIDPIGLAIHPITQVTGAQQAISTGGSFVFPFWVAVDADGSIIVSDQDAFGGQGAIFRVNPVTGQQTVLASGGNLGDPNGVAITSSGFLSLPLDVACGDILCSPFTGKIRAILDDHLPTGYNCNHPVNNNSA